jgi:hypothetical protein
MQPPKPHAVETAPDSSLPLEERELAACRRAFESANTVKALQDALLICAEQDRALPQWLTLGLLKRLGDVAAPPQRDVVDYVVRFLAVCEGRDLGLAWPRAYQYATAYLAPIAGAPADLRRGRLGRARRLPTLPQRVCRVVYIRRVMETEDNFSAGTICAACRQREGLGKEGA